VSFGKEASGRDRNEGSTGIQAGIQTQAVLVSKRANRLIAVEHR